MKPVDQLSDDEFAHLAQRAAQMPDAPHALVRAAIELWPARQASSLTDVAHSALRLITAVISFDSWARPAGTLAMRAGTSDTRHLLFSAQGRDIDLRISQAADHFAVSGQILGPDESGVVELAVQGDEKILSNGARTTALDDLGEFHLDDVPIGTYRLSLRTGNDEIVLPPINVGNPLP